MLSDHRDRVPIMFIAREEMRSARDNVSFPSVFSKADNVAISRTNHHAIPNLLSKILLSNSFICWGMLLGVSDSGGRFIVGKLWLRNSWTEYTNYLISATLHTGIYDKRDSCSNDTRNDENSIIDSSSNSGTCYKYRHRRFSWFTGISEFFFKISGKHVFQGTHI